MAGIEECISFRMYELLGGIAPRTHYLSFRIIDNAVEAANPRGMVNDPTMGGSGLGQYSGDLWGLYLATESPDGSFLDERGLPDGSVFKIEGGGNGTGNKKNQGPTHPVTTGDWDAFATASNGSQNESWWRTNMNMHAYYGFRLASRIVGNVDMRNGWNHYFYHHPAGPWVPIPWDLDMMFVGQTHQSASGAIGQDSSMSVPALNLEKRNRAREMLDLMLSDRSPNGGQVGQLVDEYAQIVNPSGQELTWADVDAAMWNFHPRTSGSPSSHQDSSHKGNFYYSRHTFNAFGGPYTRWLRETNFVGTAEHEDFVRYLLDYMTDTYRGRVAWAAGNGNQLGYGYEYVRSETRETVAADVPAKPTISYSGAAGFPANDLRFGCSDFSGKQASAVQWRLGWIAAPGLSGFSAGDRRRYEVEPFWTSAETSPFTNHVRVPFNIAKPGMTYRARVRHKDANGRWSRWSDPVQFVCTAPDVGVYQRGIVISEIQYHPRAATSAEAALGFLDEDFEYLEIKNVTDAPFDLTSVGFTSGVSFEFPPGSMLPACGYGLVVKNIAAFEQRYGAGRPVFGSYAPGNLRNSGELLALSYGSNTPIHTLTYSDRTPWPMEADGTGRSLELVSPNSRPNPAQPENWTYSRGSLGTPGHSDALTYSLWSTGYPGANDPAADLDGDGKRNVIEYAFVQDPSVATPEPPVTGRIETLSVDGVSRPHLVVRFNSRQDTSDLGYHVEASTDLVVWKETSILESMEKVADGTAIQRWRIPFVSGGSTQQFVRVRISICR
ncbi:MAG: hypothetical protein FJ405_13685 [Verrucomicrobia bacterium]|nr:hypothetical protein [Verrucomicrobiota bacterium]